MDQQSDDQVIFLESVIFALQNRHQFVDGNILSAVATSFFSHHRKVVLEDDQGGTGCYFTSRCDVLSFPPVAST